MAFITNIQVKKEDLLDLFKCIENFNGMLSDEIFSRLDSSTRMNLIGHISMLFRAMYTVYHPKIRSLKDEANSIYAAFLSARKSNDEKAAWFYSQYLRKKKEIKNLEDVFAQNNLSDYNS